MAYPRTGTLLQRPQINATLSTQLVIKVGRITVGAIQRLQITQRREHQVWEEIGTDGIVEIHPKGAAKISLSVERVVFDNLRLTESFGRGFVNIQSQRFPFDIEVIDLSLSDEIGNDSILHVFHNCWFSEYSPTISADSFVISERANILCERVTSSQNSISMVNGGLRGISVEYDTMERATDTIGRPGRFDPTGNLT